MIVNLILLITTPTLFASPDFQIEQVHTNLKKNFRKAERYHLITYDQFVDFLAMVETAAENNFEGFKQKDLDRIDDYLTYLAEAGKLPTTNIAALEKDIQELHSPLGYCYEIVPAIWDGSMDFVLCKSVWSRTRHFVKKYKKEIIIGAIIIAATVVVVAGVVAASTAAAAAASASAGAASSCKQPATKESPATPILEAALKEKVTALKENIIDQQFFEGGGLPMEETGRVLGTLFVHESLQNVEKNFPTYSQAIPDFSLPDFSPMRREIDEHFSSDYSHYFDDPSKEINFNSLSYHKRGEKAAAFGCYDQAIHDFTKAIEIDPTSPIPYLDRSTMYFGLGDYERSIEDFNEYASQIKEAYPAAIFQFTLGFARGLPKGIYESGHGMFLFLTNMIKDPIHSSWQMWEALSVLSNLARSKEWSLLGEALVPEVLELIHGWDKLSFDQKGERAGYIFGKYGADILVPGTVAKAVSKGVKGAKELNAVYNSLKNAEKTLVLESVAGLGSGAKAAEVINAGQKTLSLGEELGFSTREMAKLKQAGELETTVTTAYGHLDLSMQESIKLFEKAEIKLKPHQGIYMSESRIRELIHEAGIPTFPRPKGIPENYRIKLSDKPGGMKYVHPNDEGTYVRIMPGKSHSQNPSQQKPYVNHRINGISLDKHGNIVSNKSTEAHILLEEFVYREIKNN